MLILNAELYNHFHKPKTKEYEATYKLEFLYSVPIEGTEEVQTKMASLNVPEEWYKSYVPHLKRVVPIPVNAFANKAGQVQLSFPKGEVKRLPLPPLQQQK